MKEEIKIGDTVQEKEGLRRNGLVLELKTLTRMNKSTKRSILNKAISYKAAKVYWPDGKQMTYKLSFLEKMF